MASSKCGEALNFSPLFVYDSSVKIAISNAFARHKPFRSLFDVYLEETKEDDDETHGGAPVEAVTDVEDSYVL